MKKLLVIFISSFLLVSCAYFRIGQVEVTASNGYTVNNLDTGLNYTTIQEAINDNETLIRHTIFVGKGIYYENLVVNKSVILTGENRNSTIIDGRGNGSVIWITADNVTIAGFTIQNSGHTISGTIPDAGINLKDVTNCNISISKFIDNYVGIFVRSSRNSQFANNVISCNHIGIDINNRSTYNIISGNSLQENNVSIHVYYADLNTFFANNLTNSPVGVVVRYSNNNSFSDNKITDGLNGLILNDADFSNISSNMLSDLEYGIQIKTHANHNFISENNIINCSYAGIDLDNYACNNKLLNNTITNSEVGIDISNWSINNSISRNHLTANLVGLHFWYADMNKIFQNNLVSNHVGAAFLYSQNSRFYHNTLNNTQQVNISSDYINDWDDGLEGNYWKNYNGSDTDKNGIGDSLYAIDANNTDNHPLMGIFYSFNISLDKYVNVISNSTIEVFRYSKNNSTIRMHVSNTVENQTCGFCRVCIPKNLITPEYVVTVDGAKPLYVNYSLYDNCTHRWIYFAYEQSIREIVITHSLFCDLNNDRIVDMRDIGIIALALGSYPDHPRWNPQYDFNQDSEVNMIDLLLIAKNFGT